MQRHYAHHRLNGGRDIGVVTKADLASMEQISLVKSWLREAGAHNVLVTSAVNNNGVTELFALLHTEEGCC
ncbi:EutP/PduV family microcompartment system protein [Escherichia coli]|uniref:EutP/PduV family microcompartment system protein n=1 Tax=Escherichia coli TaxID=562 RepID=UPI00175AB247|nr:EutP/PduV family microcompartment system protein [Escherichia coli]EIG2070432.1 ethanolamine utilization protein [Escherichia coli]ELA4710266.1 ethanolamine utilization protein [Escherichia coli]HAJ7003293.1 ethanolamine utilization protein [Escherichia coli]HAJ7094056.1 ethanolamine utilization protein [Escherichia coli]HBB8706182.1 ethanolamine utilization protein [Escherichia coli]